MDKQKTILIIEDDPALATALEQKLRSAGYKTTVATDGNSGIADALLQKPDLLLVDIMLPGISGLDLLKKLREDNWGKTAKVVMLTNLNSEEKMVEAVEYKADAYLLKADWTLENIVSEISKHLK